MSTFQADDFGQFLVETPTSREVFDHLKEARSTYRALVEDIKEAEDGFATLSGRTDPDSDWALIASFEFVDPDDEDQDDDE